MNNTCRFFKRMDGTSISCVAWITLDFDLRVVWKKKKIHLLVFLVGGRFIGYWTPLHCTTVEAAALQLHLEIFGSIIALNILYLLHSCEGQNTTTCCSRADGAGFSNSFGQCPLLATLPHLKPSEQCF